MKDIITLNEDSQFAWQRNNNEWRRYDYKLQPTDIVIDVGAHQGEFSKEIYRRYGCNIIAIEPTDYIDGFSHGTIIKKAASDHNGQEAFSGLSLYTSTVGIADHTFPCFDINELLQKYDDIALVKFNIEGGEYKILKHMIAANTHLRIRNLQIQFHQIRNQPYIEWYDQIADSLLQSHYLTYRYAFCWENWRRTHD